MLRWVCVRTASVTRKLRPPSGILTQSVGMIEEWQTKSAGFFAQLCPDRLRLKHVSSCQYNEIALKVFAQEEGAVPKW